MDLKVKETMRRIMSGAMETREIEAFLLQLQKQGETAEEIAAAAQVLREHAVKLSRSYPDALDTCGTGGDGLHTFNISTLAAIVACAAGARVAKHGNRSVSGICGSADLLEMLGVKIDLPPAGVERCLDETGFGFFFAPLFHPATKAAMPARKNIPGKTLFNLLGPLTNPAGADFQLIGVYHESLVKTFADILLRLGSRHAMVVHGNVPGLGGLDEISLSGPTKVAEVYEGEIRTYELKPEDYGFDLVKINEFYCPHKDQNVQIARKVLEGVPGPATNIVCLNAAAALYVAGKSPSLHEGLKLAQKTVHSHQAMDKLDHIIECSNEGGDDDSR